MWTKMVEPAGQSPLALSLGAEYILLFYCFYLLSAPLS